MSKKTIFYLAILALVAFPAASLAAPAPAATTGGWEFTLGGFVKLETWWDSTQMDKALNTRTARNNDPNFHHGQLRFTAQGSRFNFTIKGPNLFGAKTSAFIEMDFDKEGDARQAASNSYTPRLRHAMFRLNWPETQLLFGQYWSFLCEFPVDLIQDGGFFLTGSPTHRLPQISLTQTFAGSWRVGAMVGSPTNPAIGADAPFELNQNKGNPFPVVNSLGLAGTSAETPQVQGIVSFEKDLYGKAGFFGKPRGFVAQVAAAWQRTRYRNNVSSAGFTGRAFGNDGFNAVTNPFQDNNQILNNWVVQGTLFIPIIPTRTANLAGTASLTTQWFVGQGVSVFGLGNDSDNSYYKWSAPIFNVNNAVVGGLYDATLQNRYGGYIQGQYYFTNQWFLTAAYGMTKAFGVTQDRNFFVSTAALNPFDRSKYLSQNDQMKALQQFALALWYQPITSVKFGLQYQYNRTDWFQKQAAFNQNAPGNTFGPGKVTDIGENHSVRFVGLYFF
jgi:hypothetical protein